jgi:hypothetical protein
MLKTWGLVVFAATLVGSSSAWTMQFELNPTQLRNMVPTASQARAIAAYKNVAVLASVPNRLFVRGPGDACADIEAIDDWDFRKQIEDHVSRAVSSRFTVVPVSYDGDALKGESGMGYTPRDALPTDEGVDAFIIVEGSVRFWHTAGLPVDSMMGMGYVPYALSKLLTEHEPEYAFTKFTVQIINAKTKRTILREEIQPFPTYGGGMFERSHWHVRGVGAKERPEADWLCGSTLTEEKKQELKNDYRMLIQAVLDFGLPILRLADAPIVQQTQ